MTAMEDYEFGRIAIILISAAIPPVLTYVGIKIIPNLSKKEALS